MSEAADNTPILTASNISKSFGAVKAIKHADFDLLRGEIHGIVGENGAGKSTLMGVLHGTHKTDSGVIKINENEYAQMTPGIAKKEGIAIIPQKMQIFPDLTVAENVFINNWSVKGLSIDWKDLCAKTKKVLAKVDLELDPTKKVGELSFIEKQMLVIARGLFIENADVVILDEPTSALVVQEVEILFNLINRLKQQGIAFIYITHFLDEIYRICDRVTVMRDGVTVACRDTKSLEMKELVTLLVGEGVDLYPPRNAKVGENVLEVKNLVVDPLIQDVSFEVKRGEILGIAGLKGSGRTELSRAIVGLDSYKSGKIVYKGRRRKFRNIKESMSAGLGYLTEERHKYGLIPGASVADNITVTFLEKILNGLGFISSKKADAKVTEYIRKMQIKVPSGKQAVGKLSGGNQQKVVIAKLLGAELDTIIFDDPTVGIDIKAKMYIHQIMNELVEQGKSIILISSDIMEVTNMSDRVILLKNGKITQNLEKGNFDEKIVMKELEGANDECN